MARLIICSSSAMLRRTLTASLSHEGHELLETDSSISLVSACLTQPIDGVILDNQLEHLSAADAIACLRCAPSLTNLGIVALGQTVRQLHEAIVAGADHGLVKPVETSTLLKLVAKLAERSLSGTLP